MITKRNIAGDDGGRIAGLSARYLADLPLFSGKGYFLGVLVMGMFAVLAHQRASQWQEQDDGFIALCRLVLLLSVGLLLVGAGMYRQTGMKKPSISRHGLSAYMAHRQPRTDPHRRAMQKRNKRRPEARVKVMENKHATYSPAFHLISWIALIGGIVTYLVGLWNADMQLNEKGYYFAVPVLGLFAAASYQKTVRDKYEAIPTTRAATTCRSSLSL